MQLRRIALPATGRIWLLMMVVSTALAVCAVLVLAWDVTAPSGESGDSSTDVRRLTLEQEVDSIVRLPLVPAPRADSSSAVQPRVPRASGRTDTGAATGTGATGAGTGTDTGGDTSTGGGTGTGAGGGTVGGGSGSVGSGGGGGGGETTSTPPVATVVVGPVTGTVQDDGSATVGVESALGDAEASTTPIAQPLLEPLGGS